MKLYRITLYYNVTRYIAAESYAEVEKIWNSEPDRKKIQTIEEITDNLIIDKKD